MNTHSPLSKDKGVTKENLTLQTSLMTCKKAREHDISVITAPCANEPSAGAACNRCTPASRCLREAAPCTQAVAGGGAQLGEAHGACVSSPHSPPVALSPGSRGHASANLAHAAAMRGAERRPGKTAPIA